VKELSERGAKEFTAAAEIKVGWEKAAASKDRGHKLGRGRMLGRSVELFSRLSRWQHRSAIRRQVGQGVQFEQSVERAGLCWC
jgi:hypothetical protein